MLLALVTALLECPNQEEFDFAYQLLLVALVDSCGYS
jgi:hypothetical protein